MSIMECVQGQYLLKHDFDYPRIFCSIKVFTRDMNLLFTVGQEGTADGVRSATTMSDGPTIETHHCNATIMLPWFVPGVPLASVHYFTQASHICLMIQEFKSLMQVQVDSEGNAWVLDNVS